jgi:hypothetical protein
MPVRLVPLRLREMTVDRRSDLFSFSEKVLDDGESIAHGALRVTALGRTGG